MVVLMIKAVKKIHESGNLLMSDERLYRMEDKLDKLSEAVFEMARLEEHLLTVFKWLKHIDTPFKMYDGLVDEIEKQVLIRGQKIASSKRLFWMVVTGAIGIAFVSLRLSKVFILGELIPHESLWFHAND